MVSSEIIFYIVRQVISERTKQNLSISVHRLQRQGLYGSQMFLHIDTIFLQDKPPEM